jgi:GATA-binding protein
MDQYSFDPYATAYSSSPSGSTPRTPSPNSSLSDSIGSVPHTPAHYKLDIEPVPIKPILIADHMNDDHQHGIAPEGVALWQANPNAPLPIPSGQYSTPPPGSLLNELYEHELPQHDQHLQDVSLASHEWHQQHHPQHHQFHHQQQQHQQQEVAALRRATYPYVRQEREDQYSLPPFLHHHDDRRAPQHVYAEPLTMLDHHSAQSGMSLAGPDHRHHSFAAHEVFEFSSPAHAYRELDPRVKLEEPSMSVIVPSHGMMYHPSQMDQLHQLPYMSHPPVPVQHTDDAASKETQYLRRRCFNCSQTEPPSWRRSTLNPGKIVCNKCGLYERTHLRPRPLRFDELRTGNKSRKKQKASTLPTPASINVVKQEHTAEAPVITRRSSVSSASSSDWDDSRMSQNLVSYSRPAG